MITWAIPRASAPTSRAQPQVNVRPLAQGGFQGADLDELRAPFEGIDKIDRRGGGGVKGIRAPVEDALGVFHFRSPRVPIHNHNS